MLQRPACRNYEYHLAKARDSDDLPVGDAVTTTMAQSLWKARLSCASGGDYREVDGHDMSAEGRDEATKPRMMAKRDFIRIVIGLRS